MPIAVLVLQVDQYHEARTIHTTRQKLRVRFFREYENSRTLLFEAEAIQGTEGSATSLPEVLRYLQIATTYDGVGSSVRAVHPPTDPRLLAHLAKALEDNFDRIVLGLRDLNLFTHTCGPMPEFDKVTEPAHVLVAPAAEQALRQAVRAAGRHADGVLPELLIAAQEVIEAQAKKIAEREETIAQQQREASADLNALSVIASALPIKVDGALSSAEIARRAVDAMQSNSRELEGARDEIVRLERALEIAQGAVPSKAPSWIQDGPFDFKLIRYELQPVAIAKIRSEPLGVSWETRGAGAAVRGDVPGDGPEALDLAKRLAEVAAGVRS